LQVAESGPSPTLSLLAAAAALAEGALAPLVTTLSGSHGVMLPQRKGTPVAEKQAHACYAHVLLAAVHALVCAHLVAAAPVRHSLLSRKCSPACTALGRFEI
jgi:hypothetical protein